MNRRDFIKGTGSEGITMPVHNKPLVKLLICVNCGQRLGRLPLGSEAVLFSNGEWTHLGSCPPPEDMSD